MTRPLRRAHLWIWLVLALILPALCIAGVVFRNLPMPANRGLSWEGYK